MTEPSPLQPATGSEIAIIGMACRFPGATGLKAYWRLLRDGVEAVTFFSQQELLASGLPEELVRDPGFVAAAGVLEDADRFDAGLFRFTPREATLMDPQHRIFLECSWEALDNAGYNHADYMPTVGVFGGGGADTYLLNNIYTNPEARSAGGFEANIGNDKAFLPSTVSYRLDLKGPSVNVQTACSTSLVAVHLACQSLLNGECSMALAGGVTVNVPQVSGYLYDKNMIFSPDGHCRAFDARARGTVGGSGGGVILLKPLAEALADGDSIHAVIKGTAINNDGSSKVGYTAPSIEGQSSVILEALEVAGVDANTIGYVEAHGTGTPLGDVIEVAALNEAFRRHTGRRGFCALGSVKTNFGHLDAAAGIAGLIKTVLALSHAELPPSLHFEEPNPEIDFAGSPFFVNTSLSPWPASEAPLRAGVSSFGIGGTNAHAVLERAPAAPASGASRSSQILLLSARSAEALEAATQRLADHLEAAPEQPLADIAYTLGIGRRILDFRRALVCDQRSEAATVLRELDPERVLTAEPEELKRPVVFMFSGQGTQSVGMAAELYRSEPVFRKEVDRCCRILEPLLGRDLRQLLYPGPDQRAAAELELRRTVHAQPALFAVEYALARLWESWGIRPAAVLGHSAGEYVAACLAGVFSLERALELVATRGRLMQDQPEGAMLAVLQSEEEIRPRLGDDLSLAAINGPFLCLVAGGHRAIAALETVLGQENIACSRLATSHAAHSEQMRNMKEPMIEAVRRAAPSSPNLPFVSCATGDWITPQEATDPEYWGRHLMQTVRFDQGLRRLFSDPRRILLEIGPDRTLSTLAAGHPERPVEQAVLASLRPPEDGLGDLQSMLRSLADFWLAGSPVDWPVFYGSERRRRVALPTYPFENQRFWVEPGAVPTLKPPALPAQGDTANGDERRPQIEDWFYQPSWSQRHLPPRSAAAASPGRRLVFLDPAGLGSRLAERWRDAGEQVITVSGGSRFVAADDGSFVLRPTSRRDYGRLLDTIGDTVDHFVHLWALEAETPPARLDLASALDHGFFSLTFLCQALAATPGRRRWIDVVCNGLHNVVPGDSVRPETATLQGPVTVAPQEVPGLRCRTIDVRLQELDLELLARELTDRDEELIVAHRGEHRWVSRLEPIRLGGWLEDSAPLRQEGVYLITGGLGGVGLVLAQHLAATVRARLVLTGRSQPPPREDWPAVAADRSHPWEGRVRHLLEIEALSGEVLPVATDAADVEAMGSLLDRIAQRFGALDGIVHAASLPRSEAFQELRVITREDAERQFRPKIGGALALEAALEAALAKVRFERPPDFVLLMSSISSALGGPGLTSYAAANFFLDALAAQRRGRPGYWLSVNWDGWQTLDDANAGIDTGDSLVMSPSEGASAFRRALGAPPLSRILVSAGDLDRRVATWTHQQPQDAARPKQRPRPRLRTPYVAPQDAVEKELTRLWTGLLGYDELGTRDNFFGLGGHSLMAIRLMSEVAACLAVEVPVRRFFEAPTIAGLARIIEELRADEGSDEARLAEILDQVEELSPGELAHLLADNAPPGTSS